ncbi:MAG: GTP-binding protein [Chloroflexota bacterium]
MKVNVVIVGHVDHGKSTLIGRLLYDSDSITEGRVAEVQRLAEEFKRRFEFAYFLDSFDDELKEERTIDTTGVMFKSKQNLYAVSDVPGHKEFIKNMLSGASHADAAVLVVSAKEGIEEQTRRHAFLIHMLGIRQVLVLVNKMDAVGYDEAVFDRIKDGVAKLFDSIGLSAKTFIPGSAMEGDNIYKPSDRMPWYRGGTLIEALDALKIAHELRPLRFVVQDVYDVKDEKVAVGRVESGTVKVGDEVIFQPSGLRSRVEKIRRFEGEQTGAASGEAIGIVVSGAPKRGEVMGLTASPPVPVRRFVGEVVLLDERLEQGETVELRCGTSRVKAKVSEIREKIDSETGVVTASHPDHIVQPEAATILFETEPLVVERFADIPELGRFVLVRKSNIGAGIVLEK